MTGHALHIAPCGPSRHAEWDAFVEAHPARPLFHSRRWLSLLARHQGVRLDLHCIEAQGRVVGLLPMFSRGYGIIRVHSSPYVVTDTPYLGPLVDDDVSPHALWAALLDHARHSGMDFVRLFTRVGMACPPVDGTPAGVQRKTTHVLDLTPGEEALWNGLEGRCRTAVRKAAKEGVTVEPMADDAALERFVDMLEGVYARQGLTSPNTRAFYRDVWRTFGGREVVGLTARHEGRDIASALFVMDARDAYYISGASAGDCGRLSPNNILQWEAIRLALARGVVRYDFVGSDIPRIARFKASFGGQLHEYWCVECAPSRVARFMRAAYPWLKRRLGRV
ncbi:lipid II:glycine glycyltransferase FemX [Nitratidesulfovibrio vulgaris]|uniref:Methicillin resistance protein n=1 Tax=Nitratidesulfovibrio vulgaris (strain DP4) TaxID=391774 RepID=A0A0H3ACL4_NITV4|nr:GNAT family N-acetyltransferase [Nitratidesulfovibrio vulgaris]ABM30056.1 Methicillin resistance protein [Nitratidesulfovibrio vulgaris DP4]WCB48250.1 GNAT family N-acetyltransferase [Nitratidesulfovibrio vulgaris]